MIKHILLSAALFVAPIVASAQGEPRCNIPFDHWDVGLSHELDGFWQVTSKVGTLEMAGRVMPLPAGRPSTAGITMKDSALTISSDMIGGEYPLEWVDPAESWDFTPGPGVPVNAADFLDDEELAVLMGCEDANTLPRLRAVGSFTEPEGRVDFQLLLYMVDTNLLYGITIGKLNDGQGTARRILALTR